MVRFMVIAAPRSGTTWAANWLTTDKTLCLHDPLIHTFYRDLDAISYGNRVIGVSCTGLCNYPVWLNTHSARKLILHRDNKEIDESAARLGLPKIYRNWEAALEDVVGLHMQWSELFEENHAQTAWRHLIGTEMDVPRYRELIQMNVQPSFMRYNLDRNAVNRWMRDIRGVA